MPEIGTQKHEGNNFDAIRLMAAIAVIYSHAYALTKLPEPRLMGNSVGAISVKIFFVISGYLVYTSLARDPNIVRYLTKRALRIFPALIVLCVFTVFIIGPLFTTIQLNEYFTGNSTWLYFENILLYTRYYLPGVFINNSYPLAINGSLWSLPLEFALYLMLPLVVFAGRIAKFNLLLPLATLTLCVLSLWLVRISPPTHQFVFYRTLLSATLDCAPYFMIGALVKHMNWERWLDPMLALFLVIVVAFIAPRNTVVSEAILYLLIPYVVLSLGCSAQRWLRHAGRWGDPSYGIYIYAFLVQQCVCDLMENRLTAVQNALVTLPIVLILAFISWHLIEKPALAFKPRGRRRRAAVVCASKLPEHDPPEDQKCVLPQ